MIINARLLLLCFVLGNNLMTVQISLEFYSDETTSVTTLTSACTNNRSQ